jgi:hypothetical protein
MLLPALNLPHAVSRDYNMKTVSFCAPRAVVEDCRNKQRIHLQNYGTHCARRMPKRNITKMLHANIHTDTSSVQNPTPVVLVADGGNVLGRQTGLWPTKPRCEASCQRLHDTEVMITVSLAIPSGHRVAPCHMYAFHPDGALRVVTSIPRFLWN